MALHALTIPKYTTPFKYESYCTGRRQESERAASIKTEMLISSTDKGEAHKYFHS